MKKSTGLRIDHFPANGRPSPGKGSNHEATSAKEHMPESGARSRPGGQFSAGGHSGTPKADAKAGTLSAHAGAKAPEHGNHPKGSHVPHGEHHQANHRAPTTHDEFHALGHPGKSGY